MKNFRNNIYTEDLTKLSKLQTLVEIMLSLPWLALEIILIFFGHTILAVPFAFYLFLTGLRQVHGGYHLSLGISRKATDYFLLLMSLVMLGSMHAIKFNHLAHHRHNLSSEDIEAKSAHMKWWQAIIFGPLFPIILHKNAINKANKTYSYWIKLELLGNFLVILLAIILAVSNITSVLLIHVILMAMGQCLTAFFAVWTVHHDCDTSGAFARTQNGKIKNLLSYNMFFHIEHHLYPKIPQRNLPFLAARLQQAAPELRSKMVF